MGPKSLSREMQGFEVKVLGCHAVHGGRFIGCIEFRVEGLQLWVWGSGLTI